MAEHLENASTDDSLPAPRIMSLEELEKLLEQGLEITVETARREMLPGPGLFFRNPPQAFSLFPELQEKENTGKVLTQQLLSQLRREHRNAFRDAGAKIFYYDEWDHTIGDYRTEWCKLLEKEVCRDDGGFVAEVRATYGPLIPSVRRQFEKLRPEEYRKEKSLLDGEEIDLDRSVEYLVDRMCGLPGTNRLYQERRKVQRDVCTVFLVDMSSSTSEPVGLPVSGAHGGGGSNGGKRIIDIEKEALILMAEALETIGDRYGIYGFSGCGRIQVEFHTIKDFSQRYSSQVRERIGAIEPGGSTRMGTALRHCRAKLNKEAARRKNLFLISDGFPQDQDYGFDRTSHEYGVQDTARALAELSADGTYTYCITVDRSGEDYLRKMCPESQYMVIHDIFSLPEALLKIYRKVTT
jgi:nitric oxide reductase activation protein